MNLFFSLLAGVIFGLGLLISGMANPAKVIGFLDITRLWDPSLAFVMGGAISVGFFAFRSMKKRTQSVCGGAIHLPSNTKIDKRLIGGAILFGLGWGLAGICPGPALVLLGAGVGKGIAFVAAMLAGMLIFEQLEKARKERQAK
ncbi:MULTISPECIES: DUF6691 family protein [unclassified Serratia (in: enterobacteria)]|uniref:DUF6691 family protein n=1 Tax=unclassified Serratia (in: enterobacteria) TaxID=2647522 RepID=UPI000504D4B4|nr:MULTISPECIES: DUF6691 family protein [unclassified Serratia (in: enterobacteria)]KFK95705.1 membrane protein [Serratia sp. Ag2]KFK95951.1 membrane protein [Serratia sp. Ag1]